MLLALGGGTWVHQDRFSLDDLVLVLFISDQGFSSQGLVWKPQSSLLDTPGCLSSEHKAGCIGPCSVRRGHEVWVEVAWATGVWEP